jgi:hypothetical protein
LKAQILDAISRPEHKAYKIIQLHYYMDRFLHHHTDRVIRLVKNEGYRFIGEVHEHLNVTSSVGILKGSLLHYTYKGFTSYLDKKMMYSSFQAKELLRKNKGHNYFLLLVKPNIRFIKSAFIKGGYKDGYPALVVAQINGLGVFMRITKALAAKNKLKDSRFESAEHIDKFLKSQHAQLKINAKTIEKPHENGLKLKIIASLLFYKEYIFKGGIFKGKTGLINSYLTGHFYFVEQVYAWLDKHHLE